MSTYRDTFDYITDHTYPRHKYAPDPEHWLLALYFAGCRAGGFVYRALTRNPIRIFFRGVLSGWGDD